ncbi:SMI1/KNR4 family protein [Streptomyces tsukubensis]|uniref:SMI1/KNR4 family protein n=1 Tax=Streptomyces tsukubensis TaxID=83656 RepID=UPI0034502FD9
MEREFDLAPSLARGVADRAGAWEFIRGFAAHWARPLSHGDGLPETELDRAENRLGLRLPAALREAYLLLGRRTDLTGRLDPLLTPAELYVDGAGEALVFRRSDEGDASWGIPLDRRAESDPPVGIRAHLPDGTAERWEGWLERLSLCFVELVLSGSLRAPGRPCAFLDPDDTHIELLEEHAVRLPFPPCPVGREEDGGRWFLAGDVLLYDGGGMSLYARGRSAAGLERVRELIPGEWLDEGAGPVEPAEAGPQQAGSS